APVHDGGVELHDAVLVGHPAVADGPDLRIVLHDVDAGFEGVEEILLLGERLLRGGDEVEAIVPGGDHRRHDRRGRLRGGAFGHRSDRGGRGRAQEEVASLHFTGISRLTGGAYSPISSRRHQAPVARLSAGVVNQYCHFTQRTAIGRSPANGSPANSLSTAGSPASSFSSTVTTHGHPET